MGVTLPMPVLAPRASVAQRGAGVVTRRHGSGVKAAAPARGVGGGVATVVARRGLRLAPMSLSNKVRGIGGAGTTAATAAARAATSVAETTTAVVTRRKVLCARLSSWRAAATTAASNRILSFGFGTIRGVQLASSAAGRPNEVSTDEGGNEGVVEEDVKHHKHNGAANGANGAASGAENGDSQHINGNGPNDAEAVELDAAGASTDTGGAATPEPSKAALWWRAIKLPIYSVNLVPLTVAGALCHHWYGCIPMG